MGLAHIDHGKHHLTEVQARDLGNRLKSFWDELSPEERAHLDGALERLVDQGSDVTGHGLIEYALVVQLIALASTVIHL